MPDALTAHLKAAEVVHADFTQVRTLAALSRPVRASGSLVLARGRGVIWHVEKPLDMTYVMGPQGLMTVDAEGRKERKAARDLPVVARLGNVFQSMVQGDWKALEGQFAAQGSGTPEHWEVALSPSARGAGFIQGIRLSGGRFIDRIAIQEAAGDRMEITFSRQRTGAPVTPAEARLLAQD